MFARDITIIAVGYTILAIAILWWGRKVALPTNGGISPSEVVEGIIPGGLATLIYIWFALLFLTAWAWFWKRYQKRR